MSTTSGNAQVRASSVGEVIGSVSVDHFANLMTLDSFVTKSVSGTDAAVLTQGNLNGSVSATNDAAAFAIGNIGGNVSAGNDATLAAFGNINSTVTAGRDIVDLWAGGDINGSFTATRNIGGSLMPEDPMYGAMGGILSYGSINASFNAVGTVGDSSTGNIQPTQAVGSIAGSFTAGTSVGDLTAGGAITASTPGSIFPNDFNLASWTAPPPPASITADVLNSLSSMQMMVNMSVSDYFNDATQALSDASTALSDQQIAATSAMAMALSDLTSSNAQLRTDATDAYNQAVSDTNNAYSDARSSAYTAWGDLQVAVANMTTAATNANADAQTASANLLIEVDGQFNQIATTMGQQDDAIDGTNGLLAQTSTQVTSQIAQHTVDWNAGYKAQELAWWESHVIQPAQLIVGVATIFATGGTSLLVLGALDIGLGAASLYVNYQQGDTLGMLFDVVGLGLGIGAAFKSGYQFLNAADGCAGGFRGFVGRLMGNGGGCFRASTITYRLADVADDFESLAVEVKPMIAPEDNQSGAMLACVLIGVGGFAYERRRRRRDAERLAINTIFGNANTDENLWN